MRFMDTIDLDRAFARISTFWDPHVVGELNGQWVKCAKLRGEFVWHHHEHEDELFLVHRGSLAIHLRDRILKLGPGQFCIVPRGVEHKPVADDVVEVVLFEPASTLNTGNVRDERTKEKLTRLDR